MIDQVVDEHGMRRDELDEVMSPLRLDLSRCARSQFAESDVVDDDINIIHLRPIA